MSNIDQISDAEVERIVREKGLNAPRVTLEDINNNIRNVEFVKYISFTGQILRWAVITTMNGFAVTGKPSCAVSQANDNAEIGERIALENARNELWPLMGYVLREKLHNGMYEDVY